MIDETSYERALQKSGGYGIKEVEPGVFEATALGLKKIARGATHEEARDNLFDAIFEDEPEKKPEPLPEFTWKDVEFLKRFAELCGGGFAFDVLVDLDDVEKFSSLVTRIEAHVLKAKGEQNAD